jgi:hypothetical protein
MSASTNTSQLSKYSRVSGTSGFSLQENAAQRKAEKTNQSADIIDYMDENFDLLR